MAVISNTKRFAFLSFLPHGPLRRLVPCLLLAWLLLVCGACSKPMEEGVVAMVNDQPITLKELEATYDLVHLGWGGQPAVTVAALREQYGMVLGQMIIQTLVQQELAANEASVTVDERNQAEALVRMDYPPGEFERMLLEEYIDLETWRALLERNLAVEKFRRTVLRDAIPLKPEDVIDYYNANRQEFIQPAMMRLVHVTGPSRTMVRDAAMAYAKNPHVPTIMAEYSGVFLQEMTMQEDRLPRLWVQDVRTLPRVTPSVVRANQAGFESLIVLERTPAQQLDAGKGAPLAQDKLLQNRLEAAFTAWAQAALDEADIRVSSHLLAEVREEELLDDGLDATLTPNATQPGMPLGEEGLEFDDGGSLDPSALTPDDLNGTDYNGTGDNASAPTS